MPFGADTTSLPWASPYSVPQSPAGASVDMRRTHHSHTSLWRPMETVRNRLHPAYPGTSSPLYHHGLSSWAPFSSLPTRVPRSPSQDGSSLSSSPRVTAIHLGSAMSRPVSGPEVL